MDKNITPFEALQEATARAGGQSAMARICGKTQPTVWKWLQSSKRLPAEHAITVEAETGISRHLLRPDIYPLETSAAALPASAIADPTPLCGPILARRAFPRHGKTQSSLDTENSRERAA